MRIPFTCYCFAKYLRFPGSDYCPRGQIIWNTEKCIGVKDPEGWRIKVNVSYRFSFITESNVSNLSFLVSLKRVENYGETSTELFVFSWFIIQTIKTIKAGRNIAFRLFLRRTGQLQEVLLNRVSLTWSYQNLDVRIGKIKRKATGRRIIRIFREQIGRVPEIMRNIHLILIKRKF